MPDKVTDIVLAAERLRAGDVVAFPTETVYGLGAVAFDPRAVERVFAIKGRPANNPLIVHVTGPEMARAIVAPGAWTDAADRLARAFWPGGEHAGPLSIVLPKSDRIPPIVTGGGPNVAVRCPEHPVALALLFELQLPLVGPSANPSGSISPTTAEHVRAAFNDQVPVLDGGPCRAGIESTVISLAGPRPRILRPGLVTAEAIARILGEEIENAAPQPQPGAPLDAPGLLPRHYAPRTRARLLDLNALLDELRHAPHARRVILSHSLSDAANIITLPTDPESYAHRLYAALREADARALDEILIERPTGAHPHWRAILDRLTRATAD